jgi:Na+/proline symporter
MSLIQLAVITFVGITVLIGFWSFFRIKGRAINYYKAGATMPAWVVGITLCAQAFDANGSMGSAAMSYEAGFWSGASIPIGLGICLFITGFFFARPIHRMNLMTLPDFYNRRYDKHTETAASISMLFSNIILIAGNLAGLGLLFSLIFNVSYLFMLISIAIIILMYATTGGFIASVSTSVFQVFVFIIGILLSFFWLTTEYGWANMMSQVPDTYKNLDGLFKVKNGSLANWAAIVSMALGDIVAIDFIQRVISSKSPQSAQKGCYLGGILTLLVGIPTALIGLYAFHFDKLANKDLLVDIALNNMPEMIGIFLILGIIGASMSTAAGVILDLSNILTRNLFQKYSSGINSNRKILILARLIAIPTMVLASTIAYYHPKPGSLLILAFDIVLAGCFVPLLLGIYWKKANTIAAISSVIFGAILRLTLYLIIPDSLRGLDTLLTPLIIFFLFIIISLKTQHISKPKFEMIDYIPREEELIRGAY